MPMNTRHHPLQIYQGNLGAGLISRLEHNTIHHMIVCDFESELPTEKNWLEFLRTSSKSAILNTRESARMR